MGKYILKRILILLPTLFAIMVISFVISRGTPGDPVVDEMADLDRPGVRMDREMVERRYLQVSRDKGLDRPVFYFSLTNWAMPDTLYRIVRLGDRSNLESLVSRYGNWEKISAYYQEVLEAEDVAYGMEVSKIAYDTLNEAKLLLNDLRTTSGPDEIKYRLDRLAELVSPGLPSMAPLAPAIRSVSQRYQEVLSHPETWKLYVPALHLYGFRNQFHHWLVRMFSLDFGNSYLDDIPVRSKIADAMPWTLFMGFFSFVIAYLIAIPVGVYSVRNRNSWQDKGVTTFFFLLYSVPSFVAAMLVMTFFCNPEYFYLFPTSGVSSDGAENWGFFARMLDYAHHLALPTLIYSYGSIAFLSRQMRVGMMETINMDFIRTARAKGLREREVIWKHALRNSILPIITHLSTLFPRLVGGAVITETIFSIPGMGRLTVQSVFSFDHPTLLALFTIGAVMTLVGVLVSDILYAIADPRISFTGK